MILKLIPGFLLGQWAALILWMPLQAFFQKGSAITISLSLIPLFAFLIIAARSETVRLAWGRCFLITGTIFFAMPLMLAAIGQIEALGADSLGQSNGTTGSGFPGEFVGAVGLAMSAAISIFFGLIFLVPAIVLLRQPKSSAKASDTRSPQGD